jgi:hypothetical protein
MIYMALLKAAAGCIRAEREHHAIYHSAAGPQVMWFWLVLD